MKPKTLIAAVLIALGIVAFVYQGVAYVTHGKDVNVERHHIPLPPILGAIALVGGIALLLVDKRDFHRSSAPGSEESWNGNSR